jgi:AbrB family looped-hinge helix DNA binding protein
MPISTITSKGQVTIPKKVRERLRLRTGDKLDFQIEDDGSLRVHAIAKKVSEVFGHFARKGNRARSAREVKGLLREAFREGRV